MEAHQKAQIEHYLAEFTKLCNSFNYDNNGKLTEYWRGQVFGISKVVDCLGLDIDTSYYLKQLP